MNTDTTASAAQNLILITLENGEYTTTNSANAQQTYLNRFHDAFATVEEALRPCF